MVMGPGERARRASRGVPGRPERLVRRRDRLARHALLRAVPLRLQGSVSIRISHLIYQSFFIHASLILVILIQC